MIRISSAAFLMLFGALSTAAAVPLRTHVVMATGQQLTHTTSGSLLTVKAVPEKAVAIHFTQYGNTVTLSATRTGEAKVMCEYADNRIGEVLLVTVVTPAVRQRYESTVSSLGSMEGVGESSISAVRDRVFVTGKLYSASDLERCVAREKESAGGVRMVCAARLASAAPAIHPELGFVPRASLELDESASSTSNAFTSGVEGPSTWSVVVRFGDVPVFRAAASDREAILGWSLGLVSRLNAIADESRRAAASGHPFPVAFRSAVNGSNVEIRGSWNFSQGSGGEVVAKVPADELRDTSAQSGIAAERLVAWWAALLEDAFRAYVFAERPIRSTGAATGSPLAPLYDNALRLRGSEMAPDSAGVALARGYFALQLESGREPLADVLTSIPADFTQAAP